MGTNEAQGTQATGWAERRHAASGARRYGGCWTLAGAAGLAALLLAGPALAGSGAAGPGWDDSHMQSRHHAVSPGPARPRISGSTRFGVLADPRPEHTADHVPATLESFTQRSWHQRKFQEGAAPAAAGVSPERGFGDTESLRRNSAGSSDLRRNAVSHRR